MARERWHIVETLFRSVTDTYRESCWRPAVDIYRGCHGWLVKFDLAGVRPEDILRQQLRAIQDELGEKSPEQADMDELRKKLEQAEMPREALAEAERALKRLERLPIAAPDYQLRRTHVELIAELPWAKTTDDMLDLDLPFDLSKVFFITTANALDTVPQPLLDRMEVLRIAGYSDEEKTHIARRYLIPRRRTEAGLEPDHLAVTDTSLHRVIRRYTREAGVRELERTLGRVCRKVAVRFAEGETRPVTVDPDDLTELLGPERFFAEAPRAASSPGGRGRPGLDAGRGRGAPCRSRAAARGQGLHVDRPTG